MAAHCPQLSQSQARAADNFVSARYFSHAIRWSRGKGINKADSGSVGAAGFAAGVGHAMMVAGDSSHRLAGMGRSRGGSRIGNNS